MTPHVRTNVARALLGENRFFGASVERELAGKTNHAQALVRALTGRSISERDARVIDDLEVCMLAADPRIWPCKIARLAASRGSALVGYAVALAAQESDAVGCWSTDHAARYFLELGATLGPSWEVADVAVHVKRDLASGRRFYGFGVPFRPVDERVVAALGCLETHGRAAGRYITLACAVGTVLAEEKGLPLNIGGAYTAVLLDLGFAPHEVRLLATIGLELPLLANAVEGASQRDAVLQRLPDECVEYKGPPPRRSPRFRGPK